MRRSERGSTLIIATIVVVIVAVLGVGLLRFSTREVAGASAGQRAQALASCADAARQLLQSRFHVLGVNPTEIAVLNEPLDGAAGRFRAVGGHIDGDPGRPIVTVKQVQPMPMGSFDAGEYSADATNRLGGAGGASGTALGGTPLKVTVHCQEGDLSSPTSGRQLEIEFGIRFGL